MTAPKRARREVQAMQITDRDRRWMNSKVYQLWRFVVLNVRILRAVAHSKRA